MNRNKWMKLVAVTVIACAATAFAAETASVKGNPDSKVYHKSTCRYYNAKSSSKEYKTEADAKKDGYKPCKQCAAPKTDKKSKTSAGSK